MLNPEIKVGSSLGTTYPITYEVGSFKEVSNYNKILDTGFFKTVSTSISTNMERLVEGNWIFVDNTLKYIIDKSKKVRDYKKGLESRWTAHVDLISLTVMLQKCVLPNKSIRQPITVGATMKTVKGEIEKLVELYASQYKGITNWVVNYPDPDEICDEFTWNEPTLYEAICDLSSDKNLVPAVSYDGTNFIINFVDITTSSGVQYDPQFVNGHEISHSLENNPQRMVNIIKNNISNQTIKEYNAYQKSKIGVYDDADEGTYAPTSFNINRPVKVYAKANLGLYEYTSGFGIVSGHNAGYYLFDITDFVIEKGQFDAMPFDPDKVPTQYSDRNYRNSRLYYEKDKPNIQGLLITYKGVFGNIINFNLTYMLNYIANYNSYNMLETAGKPSTSEFAEYIFRPEDAKQFVFDIEYQTMDNLRYDIVKSTGFGSIVQNQSNSYINFDNYRKQQQDVMNRLGDAEEVLMGRVDDVANLPVRGMLYGSKLIAQVTKIYYKNHVNFMFIATSQYNRIDGDAVVNTKKRFFEIIPAEESIERNEFYTLNVISSTFTNILTCNYFKVQTYDSDNVLIKEVLLTFLRQKIDDNTYIFSAKTLDNKFAGLKVRDDGSTRYVEGVFYTDSGTGEFHHATISFANVYASSFTNWKSFPEVTSDLTILTYGTMNNMFKYKDVGEKMAFTILVKKV